MKKTLSIFALLFALLPSCVLAQNGEKGEIIRDKASHQGGIDTVPKYTETGARSNLILLDTIPELRLRIDSLKKLELAITLQLIKARLEWVEAAFIDSTASSREEMHNSQLDKAKSLTLKLEQALVEVKQQITMMGKSSELAVAPQNIEPNVPLTTSLPEKSQQKMVTAQSLPKTSNTANDIANGILLLPPQVPCEGGIYVIDPATKKDRWENGATQLFSHTDIALEQMFPNADFITCSGYLTAMPGGIRLLNLEFVVSTANASQIFGELPAGEFIEVTFLDGRSIRLFNSLPSNGQWMPTRNAFVAKGRYNIGFREEKMLRSKEVQRVLVRWSKVQEAYTIYEVDFFLHQLGCLDELMKVR